MVPLRSMRCTKMEKTETFTMTETRVIANLWGNLRRNIVSKIWLDVYYVDLSFCIMLLKPITLAFGTVSSNTMQILSTQTSNNVS